MHIKINLLHTVNRAPERANSEINMLFFEAEISVDPNDSQFPFLWFIKFFEICNVFSF